MKHIKCSLKLSALLILAISINSCSTSTGSYTSTKHASRPFTGKAAEKALQYEGIKRNPLIVVHGFLGASLIDIKTKKNVWGTFEPKDLISISDEKMRSITHPLSKTTPIRQLKDDVIAERLMESATIKILGTEFEQDAYKDMIDILIRGGYVPENRPLPKDKKFASMFLFAYDWRRDLPENAARLGEFIKEKRAYMQKQYEKNYNVKDYHVQFDIIAHSMGGLVSRYYLRYGDQDLPKNGSMPKLNWAGSKNLDRLIIVGTPNAGFLDTFLEMKRGGGLHPYTPAALGTIPTYYQMLPAPNTRSFYYADDPTGKPIDIYDPAIWEKMKWGIANAKADKTLKIILPDIKSKEERKVIALDHLAKCLKRAKQFIEAMEIKAAPPEDVKLYLVLGYGVKTTRRAFINRKTGKVDKITYGSGDGKVLALSALWDKKLIKRDLHFMTSPIAWSGVFILRSAHMGITKDPAFEDNILFMLTMEETAKQIKDLSKLKEIK
ncbi:MAG: hypothetical protein GY756_01780 [bacterium]|nr:hypothetical protein [bacterium]